MNNYKLKIQYDGTNYSGWQIQENANSIQEIITRAINLLVKENINLVGSGRTDAGVHSLGQVANFTCDKELDISRFHYSLNSILPDDISILNIEQVDENFNSRFDAKERVYIYLISKFKSPFYYKYSIYKKYLDIKLLNELSENFLGERDFTSFCRKNSDVKNKICKVNLISWKETKNFYLFYISANRFLYGMVRTIIGTLFRVSGMKEGRSELLKIFEARNRETAGEAVEAKGLFLYNIKY